MSLHFATREIGSLAKPSWRVKAFAGRPIEESDITEAKRWGTRLALAGHEEFVQKLETGTAGLGEIDDWAVRYALALLERAGLDVVYDGEQRRTEMYDHVADFAGGFEPRGTVRSFDNKYYVKAAVVEAPSVPGPQDVEEYEFVRAHTDRGVKVPLTGAYTMVDWSYDEHYSGEGALGASAERRQDARRRFVSDVATSVISPNVNGLVESGGRLDPDRRARGRDETGGGRSRRRRVQPCHARGEGDEEHAHLLLRLLGSLARGAGARRLPGTAARVREPRFPRAREARRRPARVRADPRALPRLRLPERGLGRARHPFRLRRAGRARSRSHPLRSQRARGS